MKLFVKSGTMDKVPEFHKKHDLLVQELRREARKHANDVQRVAAALGRPRPEYAKYSKKASTKKGVKKR